MRSDRKSQLITICMLIGALAMIGLALTGTLSDVPRNGKMDSYTNTKGVLTLVAAALVMLVIQNLISNAKAQLPVAAAAD